MMFTIVMFLFAFIVVAFWLIVGPRLYRYARAHHQLPTIPRSTSQGLF